MLPVLLAALLAAGVAAALATTPFTPDRSLAPVRILVTAMACTAGVMLAVSRGYDWWVAENWEGAEPEVTGAESLVVQAVVGTGLVSCVATVAAAWGRRNWAPLALVAAWLLTGVAWYESSGELVVGDIAMEVRSGLRVATRAMLLVTLAAVAGSFGRLAERRAARRT